MTFTGELASSPSHSSRLITHSSSLATQYYPIPSTQPHPFISASRYFCNCVHICYRHNISIKVLIDTNILVAGLIGGKEPNREILRQCFKGELKPVIGNALYLEYQELLHRDNIQARCRQTTVSFEEFLDDFATICTPVDARFLWRSNLPDETDNHIIELAIAANADYILTNNLKDFAQPELLHAGYEVISPQQLLRRIRS